MQKNTNKNIATKLDEMNVEDLSKYINDSIKKYGSLKRACDQLGVKKEMLKRIFKKNKYKYDESSHEFVEDLSANEIITKPIENNELGGTLGISSTPQIIEIKKGIEIDLPESKNKKTSIWINEAVWEEFKSFNKKHKEFSNADLISMALKSYMERYEGI